MFSKTQLVLPLSLAIVILGQHGLCQESTTGGNELKPPEKRIFATIVGYEVDSARIPNYKPDVKCHFYGEILRENDAAIELKLVPSRESILEIPIPFTGEIRTFPQKVERIVRIPGREYFDPKTKKRITNPSKIQSVWLRTCYDRYTLADQVDCLRFPKDFSHRVKTLFRKLPPSGKIAKVGSGMHYVTLGSNHGVKPGQLLDIYRPSEGIRDPDTGEVLGDDRTLVARAEVVDVRPSFSKIKLSGEIEVALKVGDVAEPVIKKNAVAVLPLRSGSDSAILREVTRLAEEIKSSLVERDVPVVERVLFDRVYDELEKQQGDKFDPTVARRVGKQVGATAVIGGTMVLNKYSKQYSGSAYIRLIDVETGEILLTYTHKMQFYE